MFLDFLFIDLLAPDFQTAELKDCRETLDRARADADSVSRSNAQLQRACDELQQKLSLSESTRDSEIGTQASTSIV